MHKIIGSKSYSFCRYLNKSQISCSWMQLLRWIRYMMLNRCSKWSIFMHFRSLAVISIDARDNERIFITVLESKKLYISFIILALLCRCLESTFKIDISNGLLVITCFQSFNEVTIMMLPKWFTNSCKILAKKFCNKCHWTKFIFQEILFN